MYKTLHELCQHSNTPILLKMCPFHVLKPLPRRHFHFVEMPGLISRNRLSIEQGKEQLQEKFNFLYICKDFYNREVDKKNYLNYKYTLNKYKWNVK